MSRIFLFCCLCAVLVSCGDREYHRAADRIEKDSDRRDTSPSEELRRAPTGEMSFDDLVGIYENKRREEWQQPEFVLDFFGDLEGQTIADIGAGSGYFSFRLLKRNAEVIATEIDERFIRWLDEHVQELDSTMQSRFEARLVQGEESGLKDAEVDGILMINTIAYIADKKSYVQELKQKLRPEGKLIIVDYKSYRVPVKTPALDQRAIVGEVEKHLLDSGYESVRVYDCLLDFQWMIVAEAGGK